MMKDDKTETDSTPTVNRPESEVTEEAAGHLNAAETGSDGGIPDLAQLRVSQDFAEHARTKKVIVAVPVTKPHRQWFVRVHPDPAWRTEVAIVELKEEQESYLVDPRLFEQISQEVRVKALFAAVNRQGGTFIWPIPLPEPDGRHNPWHASALEAAGRAEEVWLRVVANRSLGIYEVWEARGHLSKPHWPDGSFEDLLKIAFRDRYIGSPDHPVLRMLRGEV